jgi:hypothetical protein
MRSLRIFAALAIIALVLCPFCLANADSQEGSDMKQQGSMSKDAAEMQEGSDMKHQGSMSKEAGGMPSKPPYCKPEACMSIMLKKEEDRERIVKEVLKDEATRDLLLEKIAGNAKLQKELMKKMKEKKHGEGFMMMHEGMMQGEGGMMKPEDMMQGEGSASKE